MTVPNQSYPTKEPTPVTFHKDSIKTVKNTQAIVPLVDELTQTHGHAHILVCFTLKREPSNRKKSHKQTHRIDAQTLILLNELNQKKVSSILVPAPCSTAHSSEQPCFKAIDGYPMSKVLHSKSETTLDLFEDTSLLQISPKAVVVCHDNSFELMMLMDYCVQNGIAFYGIHTQGPMANPMLLQFERSKAAQEQASPSTDLEKPTRQTILKHP